MAKGLNIDEILASLEQEKTAEETFAEGVADEKTEEVVEETSEETPEKPADEPAEKTASDEEPSETNEVSPEDEPNLEKVAAESDAKGRIMAQAFMDELQKIAVGDGPYTPIMDDAKAGVNELGKGEVAEAGKVDAVVAKLKEMEGVARSGSYVQNNGEAAPAPAKQPNEKTAEAEESPESRIISNLYDSYFTEGTSNE